VASHPATDLPRAPARNDLLVDTAIAVAVLVASLGLLAAGESEAGAGDLDVPGVLFTALASLPLVARRVAPLPVFVLTALASAVAYGVAEPVGPPIGPTVALYSAAAGGEASRGRTRLTLALVAAMLVAHATAAGGFPSAEILYGGLLWGGAWIAGDRTRLRRERMAELEERARRSERDAERERRLAAAEERGRIARDLHDSAGHAINVILVHAGLGRISTERDPESTREAFATIEEVARETVGEIDQMVRVLREDASMPEEVEPPPGLAALEGLVERHRAAGLGVTTRIAGDPRPLHPAVDRGAYRILQEALTNAARHGDGSAEVEVAFGDGELELDVANPLAADRHARASGGGGHGVVGMRERAQLLGGSLEAGVHEGRFRLRARLPFAADRA
jgi:signal transduction histidine kinase